MMCRPATVELMTHPPNQDYLISCLLGTQTLADVSALQRLLDTDLGYIRSGCLRLATDSAGAAYARGRVAGPSRPSSPGWCRTADLL